MLIIPDADNAILGYYQRCGEDPVVVYDYDLLVKHFVKQGMSDDEAEEWVNFNILGAWVGPGTPAILFRATRDEIDDLAEDTSP